MSKEPDSVRASRAKSAKPYLDELINEVKNSILATFIDMDPFDNDAVESIKLLKVQYDGIVKLQEAVQSHINSGIMSEMEQ